jgi:hypothetical protein
MKTGRVGILGAGAGMDGKISEQGVKISASQLAESTANI